MFKLFNKYTLVLCLIVSSGMASASLIQASAVLNYAQEVSPSNPTPSNASGVASLVFNTDTLTLDIETIITGITLADITFPNGGLAFSGIGPFHIHTGVAGQNGGVVVPFNLPSYFSETNDGLSIIAMGVAFNADLIDDLLAGGLYLNLHTLDYASGEIRGQISAVSSPAALALVLLGLVLLVNHRRAKQV